MKNEIKSTIMILALACASLLTACEAKIEGGDPGNTSLVAPPDTFEDKVTGPNFDGTYKSVCTRSWRQSGKYEIINLKVAGRALERKTEMFLDSSCLSPTTGGKMEVGNFRYEAKNSAGHYELECKFAMTNGSYYQWENVQWTNGVLYISNQIGGGQVPTVKMNSVTALYDFED